MLAGVCALLWVAGSVSVTYGNLSPQWTMPHCPQGPAHHAQHSQNHCPWHCDGIDTQANTGKTPGSQTDLSAYLTGTGGRTLQALAFRSEIIPRGPPAEPIS